MSSWSVIIKYESDIAQVICYVRAAILSGSQVVSIRPYRKKRSLAQNSLMWLWYSEIQKHIFETQGDTYSSEDIHEWFKKLFLPKRVIEFKSQSLEIQTGTKELNVMDMMDYLDKLDYYCADKLDLILTKPDDLWVDAFGKAG